MIASGTGRYADPWHPYPQTSALVAEILQGAGFETIIDEVDSAMGRLDGADLLIVNAGDPWRGEEGSTAPEAAVDQFAHALRRGIGVLALHAAVTSMRDYPEWAPAIGAMWVPTLSFHPPADDTVIRFEALPNGTTGGEFAVFDERYCRLQRLGRSTVLAHHEGSDAPEPAAWIRTHGASRVAVDVLGHDERSYESAGHRTLIAALARWAAGADDAPTEGPASAARRPSR
ncbi:MAG TPA: ThuA domain-containing protein [Microbacterium sp.]|uniref:ThuA domain-containing protein n=1 Tax=Microbacterium sp. TaxID=51671 RepID=UPI002C1B2ADE|nr:ThuA domain-containing protein [Microbacterium sp.]HWI30084.1 ThuA domain-containing protein [Microbacterium sp.]